MWKAAVSPGRYPALAVAAPCATRHTTLFDGLLSAEPMGGMPPRFDHYAGRGCAGAPRGHDPASPKRSCLRT